MAHRRVNEPVSSATSQTLETSGLEPLADEDAAAAFLGLSPKTLQRWRWCGRGPAWTKLGAGGVVRYRPEDLRAFVEAGYRRISERARATGQPSG